MKIKQLHATHETSETIALEIPEIKGWIKIYLKNINNKINKTKTGLNMNLKLISIYGILFNLLYDTNRDDLQ